MDGNGPGRVFEYQARHADLARQSTPWPATGWLNSIRAERVGATPTHWTIIIKNN